MRLLLVSSDPFITNLRPPPRRIRNSLSAEILQLLAAPEIPGTSTSDEKMETSTSSADIDKLSTSESDSREIQSDYESDY